MIHWHVLCARFFYNETGMKKIIISGLVLLGMIQATTAQEGNNGSNLRAAIESKNYVFTAQSVTPQRGRLRQLTTEYDLVVRPDSIIAFLPYFGRAFSAPFDPSEAGIKFTSTEFDYSEKPGKKNATRVTIVPKDGKDANQLYLEIFENGRAFLRVNSNNRQSISYDGWVREGKPLAQKAF